MKRNNCNLSWFELFYIDIEGVSLLSPTYSVYIYVAVKWVGLRLIRFLVNKNQFVNNFNPKAFNAENHLKCKWHRLR